MVWHINAEVVGIFLNYGYIKKGYGMYDLILNIAW